MDQEQIDALNAKLEEHVYGIEEGLRLSSTLSGTLIVLDNGEEWTFPSLPLGARGETLSQRFDEIKAQKTNEKDMINKLFSLFTDMLRLNYPLLSKFQSNYLFSMGHVSRLMVVIGGQGGISGHLHIGEGARIAAKSGVGSSVPAGVQVGGYPAMPIRQWHRQVTTLARLATRKGK